MPSVLVFDDSEQSSVLREAPSDVLVFETKAGAQESVEESPQDFLLIDATRSPVTVVAEDTGADVVTITPGGPPGPPGPQGAQGVQGLPGLDGPGAWFQAYSFATPSTLWTIVHNRNSFALNVETVDTSGELIEGNVRYVDANTIEVDWYYPMAGEARLFR